MRTITEQPHVLTRQATRSISADLASTALPTFWLLVGLFMSLAYGHVGFVFPALEGQLPYPFFPVQGVILAVLLMTPARHWGLYLALYYGILVLDGIWLSPLPLATWYLLASNVANVLEPLVGALLLRRWMSLPPRFTHLREAVVYIACVALASAVGATWGATMRAIAGFDLLSSLRGWFLADVLASLILTPTILLCADRARQPHRPISGARAIEAALLILGLVVVETLVFGTQPSTYGAESAAAPALLYLPVPLLVWAAARFGPLGIACALSLTTVLAIPGVVNGLGPFVDASMAASSFQLQLFLLGVGVPLFCLAAVVHEQREARAELQHSETRYRVVVGNLPQGIVLLFDSNLRHLFVDGQGLPALGLTHALIQDKNVFEAFPPEIASALAPCYVAALRGQPTALDLHHGSHVYRADIRSVRYGDEATGMVVMQDVTEQRRAQALALSETALRATNEQLEAVSQAKSDFLSVVSHELRTPLGSIRGFSEMLRDDDLNSDERIEYAGLINSEAQRLGRLVEDLLDLDRLESGRVEMRLEPVDLGATVSAALEQAAPTTHGHVLRSTVEPSLPRLRGDPDKLAQVVGNLVANAIKYSPHGGIITVGASLDGEYDHLWIQDEGIGIPAAMLEAVFTRYTRVESVEHRAIKGTGLGLPIVRQIAELHGGRAWAESQPGRGSTFHVTLPIAGPPEPDPIRDGDHQRIE
jgi:signal transduction histidine kinase/integral membrane sensor domain MASE1